MKEDFPLKGATAQVSIQLEKEVAETLKKMSEFSKYSESEIANTAIKRFIATHSDFLPKRK
jgi:predicted transcriptional regulator